MKIISTPGVTGNQSVHINGKDIVIECELLVVQYTESDQPGEQWWPVNKDQFTKEEISIILDQIN